mgnify:CR=1 FL=1
MPERFDKKFTYISSGFLGNEDYISLIEVKINDLKSFIQSEKDLSKKEGQEEYKQFILNILDGVDIADGECNTKAIRLAINSRVI